MLRIAATAAAFALLASVASQGAPLDRPPFQAPVGPIEPGILDPLDPCLLRPELCGPPDVPPDPCLENPELCQPEPPDPCETFPILCEDPPVAEDPGVETPGEETPGEETPEQETFAHSLAGTARVKAQGTKVSEPYTLLLNVDTTARTFSAMDGSGTLYVGSVAPKGKKGTKLALFLDDASADAFTADVAARGAAAAGAAPGSVLGDSTKLTLKRNEDGSVSLKIKSQVLVTGVGEVVFKASLLSE